MLFLIKLVNLQEEKLILTNKNYRKLRIGMCSIIYKSGCLIIKVLFKGREVTTHKQNTRGTMNMNAWELKYEGTF